MESADAIQIENIQYSYDADRKTPAVQDLNLQIKSGDFFALLGPNGAGKTTVISLLASLLELQKGQIQIFGNRVGTSSVKRLIGLVPQEIVNHGFFTVNEVLKFYSGYYGFLHNQKRIDFLLERLSLRAQQHKKVSFLSGGMKRRFSIAKALVHFPKILLLDEPSAGVDVELRALLWEFARELNREGTTIVLTTHYLEEAERLCHRVAIMNQGKLLALDETGAMIRSMAERVISVKLHKGNLIDVHRPLPDGLRLRETGDGFLKVACDSKVTLEEVFRSFGVQLSEVEDVRIEEGALEEAFLKIIKGDRSA